MKLIVGLGNPGKEYNGTRHNVGFSFLDYYVSAKNIGDTWIKKFDGLYLQTTINAEKVIFLKPQTYMNLSGNSVKKVMNYFDISNDDLLVISDDLDLLIGNFKLRANGSSGGHNGLKNIESNIGSCNYKRLKIGISKNNDIDTRDYVLGKFSNDDNNVLEKLFPLLLNVLDDYFIIPFDELMSKYNRKNR